MKRYTDSELMRMSEGYVDALGNAGKIDDDDWMRWFVLREEAERLADDFVKHELKFYL